MNFKSVLAFVKSDKFVVPAVAAAVAGVILAVRHRDSLFVAEELEAVEAALEA